MNLSEVLLEVLPAHGVKHIFGVPGDAVNDVTDALRRQGRIGFVGVRHEETGALAASVQAKLTGLLEAAQQGLHFRVKHQRVPGWFTARRGAESFTT